MDKNPIYQLHTLSNIELQLAKIIHMMIEGRSKSILNKWNSHRRNHQIDQCPLIQKKSYYTFIFWTFLITNGILNEGKTVNEKEKKAIYQ